LGLLGRQHSQVGSYDLIRSADGPGIRHPANALSTPLSAYSDKGKQHI